MDKLELLERAASLVDEAYVDLRKVFTRVDGWVLDLDANLPLEGGKIRDLGKRLAHAADALAESAQYLLKAADLIEDEED